MSKNFKRWLVFVALITMALFLIVAGQGLAKNNGKQIEQLGEALYFDENLSEPSGQSCASCHEPSAGFADPDSGLPVSEGVVLGLFGGRNSPSSAYAMYAPIRYFDDVAGLWIGGQFWDSRATGEVLGDPLADQALGPFLNPVEMANLDKAEVIDDVAASAYADLFEQVWGKGSLDDVNAAYDQVALSIAAFERTPLFAQFSSKYDAYLRTCLQRQGQPDDCAMGIGKKAENAGKKIFTKDEWAGLQLFMGVNNNDGVMAPGEGAMCAACHVASFTPAADNVVVPKWSPKGWVPPLFTDFTYDNLGVPVNPEIEALAGTQPQDLGLGPVVGDDAENGKFKVMTLRNIGLTVPYSHNGLFKSLQDITHFYSTRDVLGSCALTPNPQPGNNCWDEPEVPDTVNVDELGNLGLSAKDEADLVDFMNTLSDGWTP